MLKLLGQNVTNSPNLCVWTEKQEDVNGSPKTTWGHVTFAADLFVRIFFSLSHIYRLLVPGVVISLLHTLSHLSLVFDS